VIFGLLAVLSVTGTAGRFFNIAGFRRIEIALYIIMGWCCVAIAGKLISNLPPLSLWLLLAGGISYTAGVAVYLTRREFFHAIWHLFVLCGAGLQFFAVTAAMDL
jgi:hemolysin III